MHHVVTGALRQFAKGAVILTILLGSVSLPAGRSAAQSFTITDIRVEGTNRVAPQTVVGFAAIPRGQAIGAGEINAASQRIRQSGLFETVEVEPIGNTLVVRVSEYPTVGRISIEGNQRIEDDELLPLIGSVPRRVYNPVLAEDDARAIAAAYEERGRLAATVTPRIIRRSDNQVDLVFEVAEGNVVEVERISFVGNRSFSDRRLRSVLETKQAGLLRQIIQADTFIADRIALDRQLLEDFYQSRGFVDFRILNVSNEFARGRDAFFTQFTLQEGQSWDFGRVGVSTNIPELDTTDYAPLVRIRPGTTYNPRLVDNAITRIERLATRRGLNFVRATPQVTRDPRTLTLNINFLLERGPRIFVERIDIEGNATTLDRVIRRQFDTVEGDPFNPREIRDAAERIRALGYFADANVESREGTAPDQVIIDVDVEEQPTGSLSFGGSYSTDSGFGVNVGFRENNFLGRGQQLSLQVGTTSSADTAVLSFTEPAFLGRDLSFRTSIFYETTDFDQADYNTRAAGFSTGISFPIGLNSSLGLRYRLSQDEILDVDRGDPEDPTDTGSSPIIVREEGEELSSSIGYSYTYDTRRTGLDPTFGVRLQFSQDLAGLGGDVNFLKTEAEATVQKLVLNEEVTLRGTIEGGAITGLDDQNTRITDRFFLSTRQLRGFEPLGIGPRDVNATNEDALGGNYFFAARAEAEFPLGLPEEYGITGGVFVDAGSVWGLDDREGEGGIEVDDDFSLRASVGVSLFWDTAFGPLRFNFAEAIEKEEFDNTRVFNFTVSTTF